MNILHISDLRGSDGGVNAVLRLHNGLKKRGIDSRVICASGIGEPSEFIQVKNWRLERKLYSLLGKISYPAGLNKFIDPTTLRILNNKACREADVLTIHGPTYNFLSYLAMPLLTRDKPALFPVYDMWSFTGHCYQSLECDKWKTGCGRCPHPEIFPSIKRDDTHLEWKLKNWAYAHSKLYVIVPSKWLEVQIRSSMLGKFPVYRIPHGIDTESYKPFDPGMCRSLIGIPDNKKVLMFMAADLGNYIKGGDLLVNALQSLPRSLKDEIVLLLVGFNGREIARSVDIQVINFGYVASDRLKSILYSAADLFIHPARGEILSLAILESMSCGTPVAAFSIGGNPDAIHDGITGLLAEPENVEKMAENIIMMLNDNLLRSDMRDNCRNTILKEFSVDRQIARYIELYEQVMQPRPLSVQISERIVG